MAKLTRILQRVFGSGAGVDQIAQFGSLAAGTPTFTTDPVVVQSLSNWLTGWSAAVIGGNAPAIEDMNAAMFEMTYQLAYLCQAGVPEWNTSTVYYIGSLANDGNGVLYRSLTDNNTGNALSSLASWARLGDNLPVSTKAANYSMTNADIAILNDASGGAFADTLPNPVGNSGKYFILKKIDSTFNTVTISPNSSETIDGLSSFSLNTQNESVSLFTDNTNWFINSRVIPSVWTSYTPTFTGFGTVSTQAFWWRRSGDSIEIKGRFTSVINAVTEARVSLPSGLTSANSSKINSVLEIAGSVNRNTDSNDTVFSTLIEPSVGYITFGSNAAGTNFGVAGLTKLNASAFLTNGDNIALWAKLPIAGWNG